MNAVLRRRAIGSALLASMLFGGAPTSWAQPPDAGAGVEEAAPRPGEEAGEDPAGVEEPEAPLDAESEPDPVGDPAAEPVPEAEPTGPAADSESGEPEAEAPALDEEEGSEVDAIEDLSLEDLLGMTVTATGTQMTIEEAPSVVEVVTHRDIRRRGYRTVAEALQHVTGLHVVDDHLYQLVGVRGIFSATGTPNDVVQVMINGQPVAFRPTGGNFLGFELIPIEAVDRIEVLRGPASALYGANAFLGVINVITFQGGDDERPRRPRHSLTLDGYLMQNPNATTGNGSASFLTAGQVDAFRFMVAGAFHYSDRSGLTVPGIDDLIRQSLNDRDPVMYPERPQRFPSPGWDVDARRFMQQNPISRGDYERNASFYGIASYRVAEDIQLSLDGHLQYFDRNAEWQDFSFLTHGTRITHVNGFGRLRLSVGSHEPGNFALDASLAVSAGRPTSDERIVDRLVANVFQRRNFGSTAVDAAVQGDYTFAPRSSVRLGVDYTHDFEDLLRIESVSATTGAVTDDMGFSPPQREFVNVGAFAQLTWNPWDRLQVTVGARGDHNTVIACSTAVWNCLGQLGPQTIEGPTGTDVVIDGRGFFQLSSRAAIVYEFPVAGLYAKLIYGSSYKPPAPFQLFRRQLTITGSSLGNPALQPQTANTIEAQIGIRPIPGLHASVVGFSTWVEDAVLFLVESGRGVGRNADIDVQGLETSLVFSGDDHVSFFVNGSFMLRTEVRPQQRRDETDFIWSASPFNTQLPVGGYPDVVLSGGVNLHFPDAHLDANMTLRFVGPRRPTIVNNQLYNADLRNTYELPAYFVTDLTVSTVGVRLIGDLETVFSLSFRGVPGGFVEAGAGGIDIPSLGSRIHLRIQQEL